jgi:hypothetical protein
MITSSLIWTTNVITLVLECTLNVWNLQNGALYGHTLAELEEREREIDREREINTVQSHHESL